MGKYRLPNTRKYFEVIQRNITFKNLPVGKLVELLYCISKYNLISAYENYHLYIQLQLFLKPIDNINSELFTKTLYTLAYFSFANKKSTPMLEDYLNHLIEYLEINFNLLEKQNIEDILLSLCCVDSLIRYGLLQNHWKEYLTGDIIDTLCKMLLNENVKSKKSLKFETFANKYKLDYITNNRTNLFICDYVIVLNNIVIIG
jgi:hypothetical protein